eukprot:812839_1
MKIRNQFGKSNKMAGTNNKDGEEVYVAYEENVDFFVLMGTSDYTKVRVRMTPNADWRFHRFETLQAVKVVYPLEEEHQVKVFYDRKLIKEFHVKPAPGMQPKKAHVAPPQKKTRRVAKAGARPHKKKANRRLAKAPVHAYDI